mmetsp:Transcript_12753/g.29819  ORF Transcript_12753/g.29819 Transcript_12753/m.29819 type:complete len:242 (-) Transcript_12753:155-880(-)
MNRRIRFAFSSNESNRIESNRVARFLVPIGRRITVRIDTGNHLPPYVVHFCGFDAPAQSDLGVLQELHQLVDFLCLRGHVGVLLSLRWALDDPGLFLLLFFLFLVVLSLLQKPPLLGTRPSRKDDADALVAHKVFVGLGSFDRVLGPDALEVLHLVAELATEEAATRFAQDAIILVFSVEDLDAGVAPRFDLVHQGSDINGRWERFGWRGWLGLDGTLSPLFRPNVVPDIGPLPLARELES